MAADRIQQIIETFRTDINAEIHRQAIEALSKGINGVASPKTRAAKAQPTHRARKGGKRDRKDIDQLQAKLLAYVTSHPGLRIEQINSELGTSTKHLVLPIRKLLAAKVIKSKGNRRATKYFATGSVSKAVKKSGGGKRRRKSRSR